MPTPDEPAEIATASRNAAFQQRVEQFRYTRRSARNLQSGDVEHPPLTPASSKSSLKRVRESFSKTGEGTNSPNSAKKSKSSSKYVPPSRYSHLSPLVDILQPGLTLVFVGVNPGISTATSGHAYAHPSNRFWHLLHISGLTPERKLNPREDRDLPKLYNYGNTNIVDRPSKDQSELSKTEMVEGAGVLEEKFRKFKPEAICIVGKGIWEAIWKYKTGRAISKEEFHYGWQDEQYNMGKDPDDEVWPGSRIFVATSTSGLAASIPATEREEIWRRIGSWTQAKRKDENATKPS